MQHDCPIHPSSMTKWRNRVGAKRLEELLTETIRLAVLAAAGSNLRKLLGFFVGGPGGLFMRSLV